MFSMEDNAGHKQKSLQSGINIASNSSIPTKREGKDIEAIGLIDESTTTRVKNLRDERLYYQPFCSSSGDMDNNTTARRPIDHKFAYKPSCRGLGQNILAVHRGDNSQRDANLQAQRNLKSGEKCVTSHFSLESKDVAASSSSDADVMKLTSCAVSHIFNHEDSLNPALKFERHLSGSSSTCLGCGHNNYQKYSTFLFHQKMGNHLNPAIRQNGGAPMHHDVLASSNFLPFSLEIQDQKIQNHLNTGLFPSFRSLDGTELEKGNCVIDPLKRTPPSGSNVETMRICPTVDPIENLPGDPPKYSQTIHHLFFTQKTDVNMSKGHQDLRESTLSTQHKGLTITEHHMLSRDFGFCCQRRVRIPPLWSCTDREAKEGNFDAITLKVGSNGKSSAETDTMNEDGFQDKDTTFGVASCTLNKDRVGDLNIPIISDNSGRQKAESKMPVIEIPNINEELPLLRNGASPRDGIEPSTSRTESFDTEHLLSFAEQHPKAKFNSSQNSALGPEPSSRWVKRLQLSSSDSLDHGTKRTSMGEVPSHDKIEASRKNMKCSKMNFEQIMLNSRLMALDQNIKQLKEGGTSSMVGMDKSRSMVLSNPWIQRWCHSRLVTSKRNPEAVVICEPKSSKSDMDDLEKKQFLSIATMALMGKAMRGFHPCEFKKRGPVVTWNANE
ncbi:hypothetical protein Nepgr_004615 [Nepenthes gracilis]|uniref:F-box protein n=1 Tax=Nepenthes gracilis TaxID=150966 RepID=A0AAD3XFL0_NEPGR|nr:hypothetical protein Nepgr_004615 [Nepenthes gracilis]